MDCSTKILLFPQKRGKRTQSVEIEIEIEIEVVVEILEVVVDHVVESEALHVEGHGCFCRWDETTMVLFVTVVMVLVLRWFLFKWFIGLKECPRLLVGHTFNGAK